MPPPTSPVESHSDRGPGLHLLARSDSGLGQGRHCLRGFRGLGGVNCHLAALEGGPVLFHLEERRASLIFGFAEVISQWEVCKKCGIPLARHKTIE